jgi:hypothetical protein
LIGLRRISDRDELAYLDPRQLALLPIDAHTASAFIAGAAEMDLVASLSLHMDLRVPFGYGTSAGKMLFFSRFADLPLLQQFVDGAYTHGQLDRDVPVGAGELALRPQAPHPQQVFHKSRRRAMLW